MAEPPATRALNRRTLWCLGIGAAAALLALGKPLSGLVWQIFLALLLTAAALPVCRWMEKRLPRAASAVLAVLMLLAALLVGLGLLVPVIVAQISQIITEAPQLLAKASDLWAELSGQEWAALLGLSRDGPGQWIARAGQWIRSSLPGLLTGIMNGLDALSRAFLTPLLAYYFLRDREMFSYQLSLFIPCRYRRRFLAAWQEMRREARGYMRGQLLVSAAVAALTGAGLMAVGVPAWLLLGILMGACKWIPCLGPYIGGFPILLFSLPLGVDTALWAMAVTIGVQQIEIYFLSPRLMAGALGLHPVYVLLLLSVGGMIGGLWGMVAALPAFVCVRGAARVLYQTREQNPALSPEKSRI